MSATRMKMAGDVVQAFVNKGGSFDAIDDEGFTPLHMVIDNGLSKLIRNGHDFNVADANGYNDLHYAIQSNCVQRVQSMIDFGADVNQFTQNKQTPLSLALRVEFEKNEAQSSNIIEILVNAGADVNVHIEDNIPLVMYAMMNLNSSSIVDYLISSGADLDVDDSATGFTPLHLACLNYDPIICNRIQNSASNVNQPSLSGLTALHLAALAGNVEVIEQLIKNGADVNSREYTRDLTPLHLASTRGTTLCFGDLINRNNLTTRDSPYRVLRSTIREAWNNQHGSTVTLLIRNEADVNCKDSLFMRPIHYATFEPPTKIANTDVLPALLQGGAFVNIRAINGQHPLENALLFRKAEALDYLIKFGADFQSIEPQLLNQQWTLDELLNRANLMPYMVKLAAANLPSLNLDDLIDDDAMHHYYDLCLQEIERLKSHSLIEDISLHDWLTQNFLRAKPFYLNGVPKELRKQYPLYFDVIQARHRMLQERKKLLEIATTAWYKISIKLPVEIVDKLYFYLTNENLSFLADYA